ncbi:hypothetical protein ACFL3G_12855, partial [Planctomycetota bacterium]
MCKKRYYLLTAIVLWMFILSLPVFAGVSNPDDFESYAPTSNWQPTQAGQGWEFADMLGPNQIIAGYSHDGSKALKLTAGSSNGLGFWYAQVDAEGIVTLTLDCKLESGGADARVGIQIGGDSSNRGGVMLNVRGYPSVDMHIWSRDMDWNYYQVNLPDQPATSGECLGNWYTFEVRLDFNAQTATARYGPAGGAMGNWTEPLSMFVTSTNDNVRFNYINGIVCVDNLNLSRVANPEDFESYTATGDWQPNELTEGWELFGMAGPNEILAGYSHDGSQALKLTADSSVYGTGFWYTKADANGVLIFKTDCKLESGGANTRIGLQLGGDIDIHGGV